MRGLPGGPITMKQNIQALISSLVIGHLALSPCLADGKKAVKPRIIVIQAGKVYATGGNPAAKDTKGLDKPAEISRAQFKAIARWMKKQKMGPNEAFTIAESIEKAAPSSWERVAVYLGRDTTLAEIEAMLEKQTKRLSKKHRLTKQEVISK